LYAITEKQLTGNYIITRAKTNTNYWEELGIIQIVGGENKNNGAISSYDNGTSQYSLLVYTDFTPENNIEYTYGV
jgi:hypothetical protein